MNRTFTYKLTTISPVHTGNGIELNGIFDYVFDRNSRRIIIPDRHEILEHIRNDPKLIDDLCSLSNHYTLNDFFNRHRFLNQLKCSRVYSYHRLCRGIREQYRDGNGTVMIPGSGIKGSFRTSMIRNIFYNLNMAEQNNFLQTVLHERMPGEKLEEKLFGKPYEQLFKALIVTDVSFRQNQLALEEVQIANKVRNGSIREKMVNLKNGPSFPMSTVVEAIKPNSVSEMVMKWNDYFLQKGELKRVNDFPDDIESFHKIINKASLALAQYDLDYYEEDDSNRDYDHIRSLYRGLIQDIKNASGNEMILRVGWGSGWGSLTGHLLENNNWLDEFRRSQRMSKYQPGAAPFPKTRKITSRNRQKENFLGWIRLERIK
ncbi:MAG: CRISPR-associated protein Csm5 [Candidatus Marinimicrobia bacterium]|jgi:CRISPR type III-A-associated RAMP protein Csm5|nr:CRISPR-associated protein Csm5 [Candidatus Neomarinimicrobiota bacterium]